MRHGSLFSGIGGFDLAAQWMGWENVFHCEINPFCQTVLKYYWPDAEPFTDIKQTEFKKYANSIDILTGGFPCQPYSHAGKRKGKEDERHLWPEMLRAIREIQPGWVVGENVYGLINWSGGLVFDEVQTDLENEGYEVFPYVLPAISVNAPHRRDRIWFVAHAKSERSQGHRKHRKASNTPGDIWPICSDAGAFTQDNEYSNGIRQGSRREQPFTNHEGHSSGGYSPGVNTSNTNGRRQSCKEYRQTESRRVEQKILSNDWTNWPTQSPVCFGNDGIPSGLDKAAISESKWRNESIKAGGNAIVPQVVFEIFKAIEAYETQPTLF